jgi:hypothetical protein
MARTKSKRVKIKYNFYIYEDQFKTLEKMKELDDICIATRLRGWIDERLAESNIQEAEIQEQDTGFSII